MRVWNREWGSTALWSHGTSNSKGTAILINKNIDYNILKSTIDSDGRYIIIDIKIADVTYTLINIYAPNNDCPEFFKNVENELDNFVCENIIYAGDFNFVLNLTLDKKGGRKHTNFKAREENFNYIVKRDLIDIWRYKHTVEKHFTWRSNNNPPIMCRLDFFLISNSLKDYVVDTNIYHGFKSDHSLVSLHICNEDEKPGKGTWKFNVSLLQDPEYTNMVSTV